MSNEKQDLINHRLTATACKNYTDREIKKAKDELKTFFSKNTVNTDDHTNELAYQITAPSGAKLLQLQAIGGNSVKYEPSVASDDKIALVKTMPETVYDFDVNKVKGVSEVSENLLVLSDKAETTTNGITYKVENGVVYVSGTATTNVEIIFYLTISESTYTLSCFEQNITSGRARFLDDGYEYDSYYFGTDTQKKFTAKANRFDILIANGKTLTNAIIKPMLVKGSTAPTEFKVGYEGIHNNELKGFKVEGANLFDNDNTELVNQTFNASNQTLFAFSGFALKVFNLTIGQTYTITSTKTMLLGQTNSLTDSGTVYRRTSYTFTATTTYLLITNYTPNEYTDMFANIMINYGNTAKTFVPYISPTTIPTDLTSIVDSSGNKLFEDGSLKGINDVYDEITPYKAVKRFGIVDLGSLDYTYFSTNDGSLFRAKLVNISKNNLICSKYPKSSYENRYQYSIYYNEGAEALDVLDNAYTDATAFKTAMSGVYLVYELATPIEADIDLSQLKNIQGHSNGSITAQNTYDMAVPSEIRYNSIIQDTLVDSITIEGANLIGNHNLALFGNNRYIITTQNVLILPNTTYTFSNSISSGADGSISILDESLNVIQTIAQSTTNKRLVTFTTLPNAKYFKIDRWYIENTTFTIESAEVMLNVGSIALPYRPYKETITRKLPTQTSDGYGVNANAHNLRVFSDYEGNEVSKRETNVNKGDLGSLDYNYQSANTRFLSSVINGLKVYTDKLVVPNLLCKYNTVGAQDFDSNVQDKAIRVSNSLDNTNVIIRDTLYDNATVFKTSLANDPLYYELNDTSKTETDLDSFDYFFDVEEGDTITFNNPYAQQVYATYSFIIKEVKSNE